MSDLITDNIKEFFNRSPVAVAITDEFFSPLWYNKSYGDHFKPFSGIEPFLKNDFLLNSEDINRFLFEQSPLKITGVTDHLLSKRYSTKMKLHLLSFPTKAQCKSRFNTSMDFFKKVFLLSTEPLLLFDFKTGDIICLNAAFAELLDIPEEHISNLNIRDIFFESAGTIEKYISKPEPFLKHFMLKAVRVDGEEIFLGITPSVFENDDENIILFNVRDVSSQVLNQVEELSGGFQYAFLSNSIAEGVVVSENKKIIDMNDSACNIWGYSKNEAIGKPISELFLDIRTYFINSSDAGEENDDDRRINFTGIKNDGSAFEGEKVSKTFTANERILHLTIAKDLTEHNKVKYMQREKKNFEQTVLDAQPNIILVYDSNNKMVSCNRALLNFFKCESIDAFHIKHRDIRHSFKPEKGFITENTGEGWFRLPYTNQKIEYKVSMRNNEKKDDRIFFVNSNILDEETQTFVVSLSDITETMQNAYALKDVNSLLIMQNEAVKSELQFSSEILIQQAKLATMGEMIGMITHQWKQPLNTIGLIAQNVEDMIEEEEEVTNTDLTAMMASIMKHIIFMSETVDNFRDFFKPNNQRASFILIDAIKSTLLLLSPMLKKNQINIEYDLCSTSQSVLISGYPNEFKQVLMNIIINAKDAIMSRINLQPDTAADGTVKISVLKKSETQTVVIIADNGIGLDKGSIERIFDINYTTKGNAGTGIGMYMSKMIIDKIGGKISASNCPSGAQIEIELPIAGDMENR